MGKVAPFMAELDALKTSKLPEHLQEGYTTAKGHLSASLKWSAACMKADGVAKEPCPMTWNAVLEAVKQLSLLKKLLK